MPKSELQLRFRIWGPHLDPTQLTDAMDIEPTSTFLVGESRGSYAHDRASWQWWSEIGSSTEPLFEKLLALFEPHVGLLASCGDAGADLSLSAVGSISGDLVDSEAEADRRNIFSGEGSGFQPFVDADRVGIYLDPRLIRFMADIGAAFETHIDLEVSDC